nr:hypothetical protein [Tanacetum cinerariifolium]
DDLLNQMRNFMQNFQNGPPGEDKEHEATTDTELFSTKDIQPLPVQEPPQNFDMHQIIEECCVEASEELNALDSQFLLITSINSQRLDKKEQEVKIVEEQPAERRNHAEKSLQNFRDIEYVDASVPDPAIVSVEEMNVVQQEEEESDNSLLDNFSPEFETFCDHSEETRSGNTTHANYSLPEYDLFFFEIEPDHERLINLMKNDIPDDSSNDPLLEEAD